MTKTTFLIHVRDIIEGELGEFRQFADLPAAELELVAERLARAIAPTLLRDAEPERRDAA